VGYNTDFSGKINVVPPLNEFEISFIKEFSKTRHQGYVGGPYVVTDFVHLTGGEVPGAQNTPPKGQPGLWCDWVSTDDGTAIEWDGGEKFYDSAAWMTYLIDTFLSDGCTLMREMASGMDPDRFYPDEFEAFTFDHVLNGVIEAQGEETSDHWWLLVKDNVVEVHTVAEMLRSAATVTRSYLDLIEDTAGGVNVNVTVNVGDGAAYTDMGDDPATIAALDQADVEAVAGKYRLSTDEAREMIEGGAVESGGILFVNEAARDEFYAALNNGDMDESPSYADKVNAPMTEATAREIGRQIASGDYPRFRRPTNPHPMEGHRIGTSDIVGNDDYAAVMRAEYAAALDDDLDDGASVIATLDAAVADGTAGETVTSPDTLKIIECSNIEDSLWTDDDEDDAEFDPNLMFYIWSNKHQLYWGPNRSGYVTHPSQAGQYTAAEASAIITHSMRGIILGQNRAVPQSIMIPVGAE